MNEEKTDAERLKDEQLASFTDALLEGQDIERERPPLADTVETLARTLTSEAPTGELRRHVRQRVAEEWDRQHTPRRLRLFGPRQSTRRLAWAAIAALAVVALGIALLLPSGLGEVAGTAAGSSAGLVAAVLTLAIAITGWIAIRWWRRK